MIRGMESSLVIFLLFFMGVGLKIEKKKKDKEESLCFSYVCLTEVLEKAKEINTNGIYQKIIIIILTDKL